MMHSHCRCLPLTLTIRKWTSIKWEGNVSCKRLGRIHLSLLISPVRVKFPHRKIHTNSQLTPPCVRIHYTHVWMLAWSIHMDVGQLECGRLTKWFGFWGSAWTHALLRELESRTKFTGIATAAAACSRLTTPVYDTTIKRNVIFFCSAALSLPFSPPFRILAFLFGVKFLCTLRRQCFGYSILLPHQIIASFMSIRVFRSSSYSTCSPCVACAVTFACVSAMSLGHTHSHTIHVLHTRKNKKTAAAFKNKLYLLVAAANVCVCAMPVCVWCIRSEVAYSDERK